MANQNLNARITIGGAVSGAFKNALSDTTTRIGRVGGAIKELNRRQERLRRAAAHWEAMGRDASRFHRELERVNRQLRTQQRLRTNMRAQEQNTRARDRMRGQLFDVAAIGIAAAAPIKVAMDFEAAMSRVGAVANASDAELGKLTGTARELGATTAFSATQAAEGMKFLAQAGFSVNDTISAMPGLLDLAAASGRSLGETSDVASNILSGFGLQAEEMGRVGDVLTNTFTSSNTDLAMLGETIKYAAPVAKQTGASLELVAAAAGKLGDQGIQGSEAGTALRAVLLRLSAPSKAASKQLAQLGIQTSDANGNLRAMPEILADLNKSMEGMGDVARSQILKTIFETEAMGSAAILMEHSASGALQDYAKSLEETGSAARVANKMNDNAAGAMKRLGSAVESIAITIGNTMLPVVTDMGNGMATVIGVIDTAAQEFPLLTKAVVMGTTALVALRVATLAGGFAFTFLRGGWLSLTNVLIRMGPALTTVVGGIRAIGLAMMANPIGMIVGGIALAAGLIYANWETVGPWFGKLWEGMKTAAAGFFDFAKTVFGWTPLGMIVNNWEPVKTWFVELWNDPMAKAREFFDWVAGKFEWITTAKNSIGDLFTFGGDDEESEPAGKSGGSWWNPWDDGDEAALPDVAPGRQGGTTISSNDTVQINVTQQPGEDGEALAQRTAQILEDRKRQQARGALFDGGMAGYGG